MSTPCGPDEQECDEGRYCEVHFAEEAKKHAWMGVVLRRNSDLPRNMNDHIYGCGCPDCMDEYRRLKR